MLLPLSRPRMEHGSLLVEFRSYDIFLPIGPYEICFPAFIIQSYCFHAVQREVAVLSGPN